jgi:hypothetical protein
MVGFPGACTYTDWIAMSMEVTEDEHISTTGDEFAWTCGYYVEYDWDGEDEVYFEIETDNAITRAVSALAFVALSAFLL